MRIWLVILFVVSAWPATAQQAISSGQLISIKPPSPPVQSAPRGQESGAETVAIGGGLRVDVYKPRRGNAKNLFAMMFRKEKAPVVLYVHGGGWIKGKRDKVYNLPDYASDRGYVLVSTDYRPVPRTTIDGQVSDVVRAIRWVRANIARYGGDPSKIVIMGHSAGSHLVSMVAAKKVGGPLRGVIANDVQAYDLPSYYALRNNSMAYVYRQAFGADRNDWVKYSPITHVRKSSGFPPFLILYSRSDYERRKRLANDFAAELKRRGTRVTLFDGRQYTHGSIARGIGVSKSVTTAVDRFLTAAFR